MSAAERLAQLALGYRLAADAAPRFGRLLELLESDPRAPSSVTASAAAVDRHVADSLSALEIAPLRAARQIADIGSGAGFPGLVLAIALPQARITLLESVGRRCEFLERARVATGTTNAAVVCARAEAWPAGLAQHDIATARALGPLALLCEYAAPLLVIGGRLIAWKGKVSRVEQAAGDRAAGELGLEAAGVIRSRPYPGSEEHHLHIYAKTAATPIRFPRRPGAARKRPLGDRR
jgi:16S rRNA (guanine527-N7)-methyltransferase